MADHSKAAQAAKSKTKKDSATSKPEACSNEGAKAKGNKGNAHTSPKQQPKAIPKENLLPIVGPPPLLASASPTGQPSLLATFTADEKVAISKLRNLLRVQQHVIRTAPAQAVASPTKRRHSKSKVEPASPPAKPLTPSFPETSGKADESTSGGPPACESQEPAYASPETKKSKGVKGSMKSMKAGIKSLVKGSSMKDTQPKMKVYLSSPLTDYEWWWLDARCLLRFLRAREMNINKAFLMLMETIKFRREAKPQILGPSAVQHLNKEGSLYRWGFDKEGRAIVMMWPAEESVKAKDDEQIQNIIYHLERAIASMGVDPESQKQDTIIFVVNYAQFAAANQPPMAVTRSFLEIFSSHYPERLFKAYIIDAPWYFTTFWNMVAPLVPTRTKEKMEFIDTTNPEHIQRMHSRIDPKILGAELGGSGEYAYDFDIYWENEAATFNVYFEYMKEKFNPNRPGGNHVPVHGGAAPSSVAEERKREEEEEEEAEADVADLVATIEQDEESEDEAMAAKVKVDEGEVLSGIPVKTNGNDPQA